MKSYRFFPMVFAFFVSCGIYSCSSNTFKGKDVATASRFPDAIERAQKDKRYFIMQSGINLYTITSVDLDRAKKTMTVTLDKIDSSHMVYVKNPEVRRSKATAGEKPVQSEIHVYMKDSTSYTLDEPHTIALEKVSRVALLD